jgi:hypothetical protein
MTKIKVVGGLIFILSITLAILSSYISNENRVNNTLLNVINEQKAFTQEISKNIFYIYKNKNASTIQLNNSIKKFIDNINSKSTLFTQVNSSDIQNKNHQITLLWNEFYLKIQTFRDNAKIVSTYSNLILEKIVNDIYNTNLKLVVEFNQLIDMHNAYFKETLSTYKTIQYTLYILLVLLLLYLFAQVQNVISFIQKFKSTSKNIITNATIKDLEPIEIKNSSAETLEASNNFNFFVEKINNSLKHSSDYIEHSYKSLEQLETNIENLLELITVMDNTNLDKELTKKEDALIQSLEELTTSAQNLQNLKKDLDNLSSHHKSI